jgi:hypothetical protein
MLLVKSAVPTTKSVSKLESVVFSVIQQLSIALFFGLQNLLKNPKKEVESIKKEVEFGSLLH